MARENDKRSLKDAQARHQAALFGGEAQKPSSQRAQAGAQARGERLTQAAAAKRQRLSDDESAKLAELRARNERAKRQTPTPPTPSQPRSQAPRPDERRLREMTQRSDLASQAIANMRSNLPRTGGATPAPPPRPAPGPASPIADPAAPPRPPRRQPPSPEELDRLLREMARRSASRRGGQAPPPPAPRSGYGPERGFDDAPAVETPPPPPEVAAEEEKSAEKQAEILKGLRAKEQAARADIKPIPQADQERAEEKPVEATVHLETRGNALTSDRLHQDIAQLQRAVRAADATGQVEGATQVQTHMPQHPLYKEDE